MFSTEMKQMISKLAERAENARYRKYSAAKAKIPKTLSASEYEAEIKRLAKRFRI